MKKYLCFGICSLMLISCKQDDYNLFDSESLVQFGPPPADLYTGGRQLADTVKSFTFFYEGEDTKLDTVYFDVYAIGGMSPIDRYFTLQQELLPNVENAKPNVHYQAFDDAAKKLCVIKANTVHTKLPIVLIRDASLKTNMMVLKFNLVSNENFALGEKELLWRKVQFTDRLSRPDAWDEPVSKHYLGKYSVEKHKFMIKETKLRWDQEMIASSTPQTDLMNYYKSLLNEKLIMYNNASQDGPLRDENDELISFPN